MAGSLGVCKIELFRERVYYRFRKVLHPSDRGGELNFAENGGVELCRELQKLNFANNGFTTALGRFCTFWPEGRVVTWHGRWGRHVALFAIWAVSGRGETH